MTAIRNVRLAIVSIVAILTVFGPATLAWADTQQVIFTIDPTQSTFQYSTVGGPFAPYSPVSAGSDTSSVSGHFVVDFNPLTDTPTSIQFMPGDGYYQQNGPMSVEGYAPPPLAQTMTASYTGLTWNFDSPVLTAGPGGTYNANTTHFTVLGGGVTETFNNNPTGTFFPATPYDDKVTAGQWTLAQTGGAGSGDWTLSVAGHYTEPTAGGVKGSTGTFTLNAVSTAHFGASNIATVDPTATQVSALGGSSTPGGVTMNLSGATNGGTLTVEQIPNSGGLSQQAVAAGQTNPIFALSTSSLSTDPQIWSVEYNGLPAGQTATLVFHYDPSMLPAGTDQSQLGIWHFNKTTNAWDFGGTVNTTDHTITFVTSSFSPFELGKAVPEPSSVALAGLGLVTLAGLRWRRRAK